MQARGEYPAYFLNRLAGKGIQLPIEDGDLDFLKENTVDFVSFSYYSTRVSIGDDNDEVEITGANIFDSVKNPYLESSEWGWQIGWKNAMASFMLTVTMKAMVHSNVPLKSRSTGINKSSQAMAQYYKSH